MMMLSNLLITFVVLFLLAVYASNDGKYLDIRVSKAIGSRNNYNLVRVSVITYSNSTDQPVSDIFTYQSAFQHRWTQFYLSTGIVEVTPGVDTIVDIGYNQTISINLPLEDSSISGVIIADPCVSTEYGSCVDEFQMPTRLPGILNAMKDDIDFFQILGDNFYDKLGDVSDTFFQSLTDGIKSKFLLTAPGNHDIWIKGNPRDFDDNDQLGNGYMQFYGQDVYASTASNVPYDFSIDPDVDQKFKLNAYNMPEAKNFFTYNKIGNIGMVSFSGAHLYSDQRGMFDEACAWLTESNPAVIFLLGHWNTPADGCVDTTVPMIYKKLQDMSTCSAVKDRMKYFQGHTHCNTVVEKDIGYMVGGNGKEWSSKGEGICENEFGIPFIDTKDSTFSIHYFPISNTVDPDLYDNLISCINTEGSIRGCYHLSETWAEIPL